MLGWQVGPDPVQAENTASPSIIEVGTMRPSGSPMPICKGGKRFSCVVDGDTIWFKGEKIRLEGFNAPDMSGSCQLESALAMRSLDRLRSMLDGAAFTIERNGKDRYDRTLATVRVHVDVGNQLVDEGLAHVWRGWKESWC
ncbi:thermonuclease family protein [Mesorhizobium sp. SB112]|uniref:thermonuclease family protein n=1 Tax=Mesorhizobium sp. SB112 TaxID=3151853 RepID=UPI003263484F